MTAPSPRGAAAFILPAALALVIVAVVAAGGCTGAGYGPETPAGTASGPAAGGAGITPRTPAEAYVVADLAYEAALRTAEDLVDMGIIATPDQQAELRRLVLAARQALDAAAAVALASQQQQPADAAAALDAADRAVAALIRFVRAKEKPSAGSASYP